MSTAALASQGTKLSVGDGASPETFTVIPQLSNISGRDGSAADIDVTDLSSSVKEFKRGLPDQGSFSASMMYIPANATHAQLNSDYSSSTEVSRNYRLTFSDSPNTLWTFPGYVSTLSIDASVDGAMTSSLSIRIKSAIIVT